MQVLISNQQVTIASASSDYPGLIIDDILGERSTASFTVVDESGTPTHYLQGQKVQITADDGTLLFLGRIDTVDETWLPVTGDLLSAVSCADLLGLADERVVATAYTDTLAGDIASDIVKTVLSQQGLVGWHALRTEDTQLEWQQGTITAGSNLLTNGGFETFTSGLANNWNIFEDVGTTGVTLSSNAGGRSGNAQSIQIANTTNTFISLFQNLGNFQYGVTYTFTIWVKVTSLFTNATARIQIDWYNGATFLSSSAATQVPIGATTSGYVQFTCSGIMPTSATTGKPVFALLISNTTNSGTLLLDDASMFAQYGNLDVDSTPGTFQLAKIAPDSITTENTLPLFAGGTLTNTVATGQPNPAQLYGRTWDDNTATSQTLFGMGAAQAITSGAYGLSCASNQNAESRLDFIPALADFWLEVDVVIPTAGGNIGIVYRTTGWQQSNDSYAYAVALTTTTLQLGKGANSASGTGAFTALYTFNWPSALTAGSTHRLRVVVQGNTHQFWLDGQPAGVSQTDSTYLAAGQIGLRVYNSASLVYFDNLVVAPIIADLELPGFRRNFDDGLLYGLSLFGASGMAHGITNGQYQLQAVATKQALARFDAQAAVADFTAELDIVIPATPAAAGLCYRTTFWGVTSNNDTYAYLAYLAQGTVNLGKGSNNGTGGFTLIQQVAVASLTVGSTHRLKIVVSGSNHQVFIDGVLKINQNDATFGAAGQFGLLASSGAGGAIYTGTFDNVGIVTVTSGTRVAPDINPSIANTSGACSVAWTATLPTNTTLLVECAVSTNSGSTFGGFAACSNGGTIPGLSPNTALAAIRLRFRYTLSTTDVTVTPQLFNVVVTVGAAFVTGAQQRVSPSLDISVADVARSATISWTTGPNNGGTLVVETSVDNGSSWQAITNGGTIAGLNWEFPAYDDGFDSDTSANYTRSGAATWTIDPMTSRMVATVGAGGPSLCTCVYTAYSVKNVEVMADFTRANDLSLVARLSGTTYYRLRVTDSTSPLSGSMRLSKVVSGVETTLAGPTSGLDIVQGDFHRIRFRVVGTTLQGWLDDTQVFNITDSAISAAGTAGLLTGQQASTAIENDITWLHVAPVGDVLTSKTVLVRQTLTCSANRDASPVLTSLTTRVCTRYIQDGPLVHQATFIYGKASECIEKMAEAADFFWNIGFDLRLRFMARTTVPAPWTVIANSGGTWPDLKDDTLQNTSNNPAYRNKEFVVGGVETTALQTEQALGDGSSRAWAFSFPFAAAPVSLKVNGVDKTWGIKGVDSGKNFYWSLGDNVLAQDSNNSILSSSDEITLQYYGMYSFVAITQDDAAIAAKLARDGIGSGIVEFVSDGTGSTSSTAAFQLANARLKKFAVDGRALSFETDRAGLAPGQMLVVNLPMFNLLGQQMLIESVHTYDFGDNTFRYQVKAILGPLTGSWTKLFVDILNAKPASIAEVSIGAGQILAIATTTSESWTWSESVTVTPATCNFPSATLYPSTSLFPC